MSKKSRPESQLYPKHHKAWDLEPYYCQHISGMTEFELHDKSDIAEQLAWRDKRIAELEQAFSDIEGAVMAHDGEELTPAEVVHRVQLLAEPYEKQFAADQPAATETDPRTPAPGVTRFEHEVTGLPFEAETGPEPRCSHVVFGIGQCVKPDKHSGPHRVPVTAAHLLDEARELGKKAETAPQGAPPVYACRRCGDSLGQENESGFCPPCENKRPYEVVRRA